MLVVAGLPQHPPFSGCFLHLILMISLEELVEPVPRSGDTCSEEVGREEGSLFNLFQHCSADCTKALLSASMPLTRRTLHSYQWNCLPFATFDAIKLCLILARQIRHTLQTGGSLLSILSSSAFSLDQLSFSVLIIKVHFCILWQETTTFCAGYVENYWEICNCRALAAFKYFHGY